MLAPVEASFIKVNTEHTAKRKIHSQTARTLCASIQDKKNKQKKKLRAQALGRLL